MAVGSAWSAIRIGRERARAEEALSQARQFAAESQVNLRDARLSEARAVRHTTLLGRRATALAAIAAAARTRSGPDLRDEAVAALILPDFRPVEKWDTKLDLPGELTFAASGGVAALVMRDANGYVRSPAKLWHWGASAPFALLDPPKAFVVGPLRFNADATRLMAALRGPKPCASGGRVNQSRISRSSHLPLPDGSQQTERFNSDYDFQSGRCPPCRRAAGGRGIAPPRERWDRNGSLEGWKESQPHSIFTGWQASGDDPNGAEVGA